MRVSQIQNLTWAGNLLVLGGLVWVGMKFWEVNKLGKQKPVELVWQKAKTDDVGKQRWPGDLAAFAHIWKTEVNGKVPPPPPPVNKDPPKPDKIAEFKGKLKYVGGWEFTQEPDRSTARINFDGKDMSISPGNSVGGFQLRSFTFNRSDPDPLKWTVRLVFVSPEGVDVVVDQAQSTMPSIVDRNAPPIKKGYGGPVAEGRVTVDHVECKGYLRDDGAWQIPDDEVAWLEAFGEEKVWSKLATQPAVGKDGVARGLRLMSFPEAGTPLAPSHGIGQGDVVTAINGVPVASKEDIMNYLRGAGRGLTKYVVDVEKDGAKRQVVYIVRRVERPAHAARD